MNLLKKTGLDCIVPASGCCGMAGSYGYESDHYQVGLDCGERVLLPSVRAAARDELIVADGFSAGDDPAGDRTSHALRRFLLRFS